MSFFNKSIIFAAIVGLLLITGCSKKEYDLTDSFDKEFTIFGDHITIPLFSLQPITFRSIMGDKAYFDYSGLDKDGNYILQTTGTSLDSKRVSKFVAMSPDGEPFTYEDEDDYGSNSIAFWFFSASGFMLTDQVYDIVVNNPLKVPVSTRGTIVLLDADEEVISEFEFSDVTVPAEGEVTVANCEIPSKGLLMDRVEFSYYIDFPENIEDAVVNASDQMGLFLNSKASFACSEKLLLSSDKVIDDIDVNISDLNIKEAVISFDANNTFPFQILIDKLSLSIDWEPVPGIEIECPEPVPAGSIANPAQVVNRQIKIKASSGYLPDFDKAQITMSIAGDSGTVGSKINDAQTLTLSNIKLVVPNGVTLFSNE